MCPNEVTLKRVGEGTNDILFNYGQMKNIHIENWWENMDFSNTRLLTAGILNCISGSFEYELDVLKKGARYDKLDSKIRWRYGKDESGRRIIDRITIEINLKVPEELREEHMKVVDEHMNHGCTITRSVKKGIPIELVINEN
jgi:uncharacterized OsmC-like protein